MMILSLPIIILLAAALAPAIYLLNYIYKQDSLEPEPKPLLIRLVIAGIVSTVLAAFTEGLGMSILGVAFDSDTVFYRIIEYYLIVGLSEEGFKYLVLKVQTWKNPNFNCTFDGVIYAVFVSLGFALWENIKYVFSYGFSTALLRAVTAVPGHCCFGVLMGVYYGLAKKSERLGYLPQSKSLRNRAVIMPMLVHGTYDFIASMGSSIGSGVFIIFILFMYARSYKLLKTMANRDEYIGEQNSFF